MTIGDPRSREGPLANAHFRTIPAQVTIKHWQLKNLIYAATTGEILYVCRHSVRTLDPRTNRIGLLSPKLSFEPRSLASRAGITVAGSEQGRVAVLRGGDKHEEEVGQSLVNGLHIHDGRVLVSSNDWTIQVYDLCTMQKESLVRCPTAVNHASVSPDGKMMAAVGDSLDAYIYVNDSGSWRRYASFPVSNDASFMASFSTAGDKLAIASQSGTLPIFDVRMLPNGKNASSALLHTIKSSRRGSRRFPHVAIRSVQWSPDPLDLLLFTEENSRATLVDGRDFTRTQDLNVPALAHLHDHQLPPTHHGYDIGDRELSGACFSTHGDKVYVGTREDISEWKVKTYDRRTFCARTLQ